MNRMEHHYLHLNKRNNLDLYKYQSISNSSPTIKVLEVRKLVDYLRVKV